MAFTLNVGGMIAILKSALEYDSRKTNDENLKIKMLVKDCLIDSSLDLPQVIFLATRQRINFWIYSLLSLLQKFEPQAIHNKTPLQSNVLLRILFRILVEDYSEKGKSKIKILTENTLEYLASVDELKMDRIVDARNLNKNHDENLKIMILVKDLHGRIL